MPSKDLFPPEEAFERVSKIKNQSQVLSALVELKRKSVKYGEKAKVARVQRKALYDSVSNYDREVKSTLKEIREAMIYLETYTKYLKEMEQTCMQIAADGEMALRKSAEDVKGLKAIWKSIEQAEAKGDKGKTELAEKAYRKAFANLMNAPHVQTAHSVELKLGKYAKSADSDLKQNFQAALAKLPKLLAKLQGDMSTFGTLVGDVSKTVKEAGERAKKLVAAGVDF